MGTWVQKTNVPYSFSYGVREQLLYNDKLYAVGGNGASAKIMSYDAVSDSYDTSLTDMNSRNYCAGEISGSTIFVFGGYFSGALVTCQKYNILTDTWSSIPNMAAAKQYMSAARLGNYIYVFGSSGNSAIYKYDIAGNTWTTQVTTHSDYSYSAVTVGNYIYIFGGHNSSNVVKKYDPINDTWITSPTLTPIPGAGLESGNAFVHGTYVYLLGGSLAKTQFLRYNTVSNSWTALDSMPYDKYAACGGITESGDLYMMSGAGNSPTLNLEYTLPPTTNPGGDINPYKSRVRG